MSLSLIQSIQQEIEQEAKIYKRVDRIVKRFLKQPINRKYRLVSSRDEAHVILIFNRSNLSSYSLILNEKGNQTIALCENTPFITMKFLKNTNPHDFRTSTIGDINNIAPPKKFYKA